MSITFSHRFLLRNIFASVPACSISASTRNRKSPASTSKPHHSLATISACRALIYSSLFCFPPCWIVPRLTVCSGILRVGDCSISCKSGRSQACQGKGNNKIMDSHKIKPMNTTNITPQISPTVRQGMEPYQAKKERQE